ncbi:MAG: glycosyltransferase [Planctomycetes bacterium]|nr:glycosyltransferase [Planctomycetota bacterium]
MRVLLVTHYYPEHGGVIEVAAGELSRRLAQRGVAITWAASDLPAIPRKSSLPMRTWNIAERVAGFAFPLWSPASLSRLWSEAEKCDLVHVHEGLYPGSVFACMFTRILGKPVVVTQHVGQIPSRAAKSLSLRLTRLLLGRAHRSLGRVVLVTCARCVFISPEVRDHFMQLFRFRQESLYIPNGVDQHTFYPVSRDERLGLRAKLGWPSDKAVLLFVGQFILSKRLASHAAIG